MADRLRDSIAAVVRSLLPARLEYTAVYDAQVVQQVGNTVDVHPRDPRLPPMSAIPLRHGVPGLSCQVQPGAWVLIAWDGPQHPFAFLWKGDETATSTTIAAQALNLGGAAGADRVLTLADFNALKATIAAATVVANDGGASFKAAINSGWPSAVGSTVVKAVR